MGTSGLGSLLVEEGLLTENDRRTIRRSSGTHGSAFARSIVAMGLMDEDELATFLAERTRFRVAAKDLMGDADKAALAAIDPPLLQRLEVLPLRLRDDTLTVAMADPLDRDTVHQLEFFTGYTVQPVIATFSQIRGCLEKTFKNYKPLSGQLEDFLTNHAVSATRRQKLTGHARSDSAALHSSHMDDPTPTATAAAAYRSGAAGSSSAGYADESIGADLAGDDGIQDDGMGSAEPAIEDEGAEAALDDIDSLDDLDGDDEGLEPAASRVVGPDPGGLGELDDSDDAAPPAAAPGRAAAAESLGDFDINGDMNMEGDLDNLFDNEGGGSDPFAESDAAASAAAEGTGLGGLEGDDALGGLGGDDALGGLGGDDALGGLEDKDAFGGLDEATSSDEADAATPNALLATSDASEDLFSGSAGADNPLAAGDDDEFGFGDDLGLGAGPAKAVPIASPAPKAPAGKAALATKAPPPPKVAPASKSAPAKSPRKTDDLESLGFGDDPLDAASHSGDADLLSAEASLSEDDDLFSGGAAGDDLLASEGDAFAGGDGGLASNDPLTAVEGSTAAGDEPLAPASTSENSFGFEDDGAELASPAEGLDRADDASDFATGLDSLSDDLLASVGGEAGGNAIAAASDDLEGLGADLTSGVMADDGLGELDADLSPNTAAGDQLEGLATDLLPSAMADDDLEGLGDDLGPAASADDDLASLNDELGSSAGADDEDLAGLGDESSGALPISANDDALEGLGDDLTGSSAAARDDDLTSFGDELETSSDDQLALFEDSTGKAPSASGDDLEGLGDGLGAGDPDSREITVDDTQTAASPSTGADDLDPLAEALGALTPQPETFAVVTNRALIAMSLAVGSQDAARLAAPALVASGLVRGVLIALPSKGEPRAFCAWHRSGAETSVDLKGLEQYAPKGLAATLKRVPESWLEIEDLARTPDLRPIQEWKKDANAKLFACVLTSASGARLAAFVAIEPKAASDAAKKEGALTVLRSLAKAC